MKVHIKELCAASNYSLSYFTKILRNKNIDNRIMLDQEDIFVLYDTLEIKNQKSYDLYVYLKNRFDFK